MQTFDLIVGGATLVAFALLFYGVFFFDTGHSRHVQRRLAAQAPRRQEQAGHLVDQDPLQLVRERRSRSASDDLGRFVPSIGVLEQRMQQAGLQTSATSYIVFSVTAGTAVAGVLFLLTAVPLLMVLATGVLVTFFLPQLVLSRRIARRRVRFVSLLPDALDLIVRGVRSGLPVTEAIATIAEEMPDPLSSVFARISNQIKIGKQLDEALDAEARKLNIAEFNFFAVSLSIQQDTGGNLAEIIDNLSGLIRRRDQLKLKVRAMSSEARSSAMIIASLPFVMGTIIMFMNPEYIRPLFEDEKGLLLLGTGLLSLLIGLGTIAKLVQFEV